MTETYLAIDAGTTAIKVALFDGTGRTLFADDLSIAVHHTPQGESETDMTAYWDTVCALTRRAAASGGDRWQHLACICVAGQGDGLWPLNSHGECFMPAILWQDTRAAAVCEGADLPLLEQAHHCNRLLPGGRGAILSWLRKNRRNDYDTIAYPLSCVSFINYRLTGVAATDESNCGDCFDVLSGQMVLPILSALGIDDIVGRFPPVFPSHAQIGTVTEKAARQSGIPVDVPVLNGCLDATAAVLGDHRLYHGIASVCAGTSLLVMCPRREAPDFPLPEGVYADRIPYEDPLYRLCFATVSGAGAIAAVKNEYFPQLPYAELFETIASIPMGCDGLIYFPFLYGERSPFYCPNAHSGYYCEKPEHTAWHRMRAAVEGVLFAARHCLDASGQTFTGVDLTGGASRAPLFCQMAADIFGLPVRVSQGVYAGTTGCLALMLRHQGKAFCPAADKEAWYQPDIENHSAADRAYHQYRRTLDELLPKWRRNGQ